MRSRLTDVSLALAVMFGPMLILLGLPVALIAYFWGFFTPCLIETRQRITGVSGLNFEIKEFDCDTIAKEGWISVYATRAGRSDKVLVFEYVNGAMDPLPRITSVDPQMVRISLPSVSSIHLRRRIWDGVTIEYDIGKIDYPGPERSE
jgi:hypothetical protein